MLYQAPVGNWTTLVPSGAVVQMPCHPGIVSMYRLTLKYFTDGVSVTIALLPAVNRFLLHCVLPPVLSGLSSMITPRSAPGVSVWPQPEIGRAAPRRGRRGPP